MLNHAERPLTLDVIEKTIARADEVGLGTIVCASTVEELTDIARLSPNLLVGLCSAGLILRSGACPAILELLGERTYELEVCNCERGGGGAPIKCGAIAARDMRLPARRLRRQV